MPLLPIFLALQATGIAHLSAQRALEPPAIDGRLDDAVWRGAPASEAFTQKRPRPGAPPSERTRVRVLYDDDAIYVGVECEQSRAPVVAKLTRRDREVEADKVTVSLDTRGDGRSAFEFGVNAAGVLYDSARSNDTDLSRDWDEVWDGRAARTRGGWSAELRIPLHALRFDPKPVQSFGLQVRRYVSARQETDEWAYSPPQVAGEVSRYGRLEGLAGLRPKDHVALLPFVTARLGRRDVEPGAEGEGLSPGASAGLDLRWHVTPQLTLNATVNPDFGQVEGDPAVLNLGTYEYFYPEKRPFFLEGADTFATPLKLVYTRRIGSAPPSPETLGDEEVVEDPAPSTIYGAAKLVGDLGGGVSLGQLTAMTGPQYVRVRRGDGSSALRLADPLTTFKALRVRGDVGGGLELGAIATATNRLEPLHAYTALSRPGERSRWLCPGGEEVPVGGRCFRDAYVGGVDARWRSSSGDYAAHGQVAASSIQGGPPRSKADGTVIAAGDASPGGSLRVAKEGGSWLWELKYAGHGRKLDYNDLGYLRRQNEQSVYAAVKLRTQEPWWETLETTTILGFFEADTLDLLNLEREVFTESTWELQSFWYVGAFAGYALPHFDDREVGDGAALERGGFGDFGVWFGSDPRARVRGQAYTYLYALDGAVRTGGNATLSVNVLPQVDVSVIPELTYESGEPRFFGESGDGSLLFFGRLAAQSLSLTLRSTYTFTPRLTLEAYAQAFLAAEAYSDHATFPVSASGPRPRILLRDLKPPPAGSAPSEDPDYETATLNANVVLRWEYRAGSTLYVVYTHAQSDTRYFGEASAGGAAGAPSRPAGLSFPLLRPRPASDVLLLKLSYWWI